jgi:hypothetical protein
MLGHGTDSFTAPPEEGMLRIFTGLNPRPWVPEASMLTTRPPKPSSHVISFWVCEYIGALQIERTILQPVGFNSLLILCVCL